MAKGEPDRLGPAGHNPVGHEFIDGTGEVLVDAGYELRHALSIAICIAAGWVMLVATYGAAPPRKPGGPSTPATQDLSAYTARGQPVYRWSGRGGAVADGIVGRDVELAGVASFLDAAREAPAGLVIHGAPGIGKTTLWSETVAAARADGRVVLACRPAEVETSLSHAALADLLADVFDDVADVLPVPQRRAIAVALLRHDPDTAEGGGAGLDQRALGAAFLAVIRALAADAGVLIAIDDEQWLDQPSARAVAFALRRLRKEPVGLVVTVRDPPRPASVDLAQSLDGESVRSIAVGPLSVGALGHLLRTRAAAHLPRPTMLRVHEASGGNPFFALEMAVALAERGPREGLRGDVPLPSSLRSLPNDRVMALPGATRAALLLAGLAFRPSVELIEAASGGIDEVRLAIEAAEGARIVELVGDEIRFCHPLLASAVRDLVDPGERRRAHAALAGVVPTLEERARHLALASTGPDESVAAVLDAAARHACRTGAADAAAELALLAAELTPPDRREARALREVSGADSLLEAGDLVGARSVVDAVIEQAEPGQVRARALLLAATIAWFDEDGAAAVQQSRQALAEAAGDDHLVATCHCRLAVFCDADTAAASEHAHAALTLLDPESDPQLVSFALFSAFFADLLLGRGARLELLERALAVEPQGRGWESSTIPAVWFKAIDRLDDSRARYLTMLRWAREAGDESSAAALLPGLAEVELVTGDCAAAERCLADAFLAAEEIGQSVDRARRAQALLDAHRGAFDDARRTAEGLLVDAESSQDHVLSAALHSILGFVELSAGDAAGSDRHFTEAQASVRSAGIVDPFQFRNEGDHVEALLAIGQRDRASAVLDDLAGRLAVLPRPWAALALARGRGLVAAVDGELADADTFMADALVVSRSLGMPFELGRTLLVKASVHRRRKEKRAAKEALEEALALFDGLGAPAWALRARAELKRTGLRPPAPLDLSETERRVAEMAAAGRTNREVAASLFMSPRTVEANLAKAYRKLGVRSRAELGALMTTEAHKRGEPPDSSGGRSS